MRCLAAISLIFTLVATALTQQTQRTSLPRDKPQPRVAEALDRNTEEILFARSVADKILGLRSLKSRTLGIARLATLLWKDDQAYARMLFERVLSLTAAEGDANETKLRSSLRREVISMIASCEAEWARQLIDSMAKSESGYNLRTRSSLSMSTALSLLSSDSDRAIEFASRSIQDDATTTYLFEFLRRLRKTNEQDANQLFLQILAHLSRQPVSDVKAFHHLGLYLFSAPEMVGTLDGFTMTLVDNILVPNIVAQRPGVPHSLVRAYLSTAGDVLWKAVSDPHQRKVAYVLAYLLLPKAQSVAPDLASRIEAAMSAIGTSVEQNLTKESAYKYIQAIPLSPEERLAKAESKPDQYSRDIAYFDLAASAWRKNDFKTARTANARISNLDASRSMGMLIDFAEAATLRENDDQIDSAIKMAYKLPAGAEKSILFLAIAKSLGEKGNKALAEQTLDAAIKASAAVEDARRPFLILIAAGHLVTMGSAAGESTWANAVKDFNRFDDAQYDSLGWFREIEVGPLKLQFPLDVPGVQFGFEVGFKQALLADLTFAMARAEELKNEDLRARALIEVAGVHLEKVASKPKKPSAEQRKNASPSQPQMPRPEKQPN